MFWFVDMDVHAVCMIVGIGMYVVRILFVSGMCLVCL